MLKSIVSSASLVLAIALPATAQAQGSSQGSASAGACPPGSWFCAQDSQQQADARRAGGEAPAAPPRSRRRAGAAIRRAPRRNVRGRDRRHPRRSSCTSRRRRSSWSQPDAPPPYEYAPPPQAPPPGRRSEWGLNLHLEGATIGHGSGGDASMGGGGLGLRFKPTRRFGIETDVDFVGGQGLPGRQPQRDGGHLQRSPLSQPAVPRADLPACGLRLVGGARHRARRDRSTTTTATSAARPASGSSSGLAAVFAINADFRGFVRGRTDQLAQSQPEFRSADGRTTNTSGGALITGALTFYF